MLYLPYGIVGGLGTGIVYVGVVGLDGELVCRPPWLRGRRSVAAVYGAWADPDFTFPFANALANAGLESTLWQFGALFAVIGVVAAQGLGLPAERPRRAARGNGTCGLRLARAALAPREMLRQPLFCADVRHDDDDVDSRPDGDLADGQLRARFRRRRPHGLRHGGPALALTVDRLTNGPLPRLLLRLGFRSLPDVRTPCSWPSRWKALPGGVAGNAGASAAIRAVVRRGVLRLERDLFPVSFHADGHIRDAPRDRQLWMAVHLPGHRLHPGRTAGCPHG